MTEPDSSDITAATLEERPPDDSNMTLDLLDDSTMSPQSQMEEKMEESPSNVQIENNMVDIKPNLDMVAVYLQNCSEYFKKNPHQLKSCSRAQVDRFDTEDPTFPSGWKVMIIMSFPYLYSCLFCLQVKITYRGDTSLTMKQREIREFLSPEFKIFRFCYIFPCSIFNSLFVSGRKLL